MSGFPQTEDARSDAQMMYLFYRRFHNMHIESPRVIRGVSFQHEFVPENIGKETEA